MVSLADIQHAYTVIQSHIIRTPIIYSPTFSAMTGAEVYLKLENLQKAGSFKIRGALNKIDSLGNSIGPKGVVAASAGNHAQGVALAAHLAGVPSTIVMPTTVSISKEKATRGYGAEVILEGNNLSESILVAQELASTGMSFIHPYDDPFIIAGQGTIGLEICTDVPTVDTILVPVGGGGLISGIATAAKGINPDITVIGVEASACPSAFQSHRHGEPTGVEAEYSIADGIMVNRVGDLPFRIMEQCVDEIVLVEEDTIAQAMLLLLERKKVLAEGAGAVPLAAILGRAVTLKHGSTVVLVLSGGNIDNPILGRVIRQGLIRNGRILHFSVILEDAPGSLAALLTHIAQQRANIIDIHHTRSLQHLPLPMTRVELEVETRGKDHTRDILETLTMEGYNVELI
jgi:threonine dehydratase